jgi:hypothetical protein
MRSANGILIALLSVVTAACGGRSANGELPPGGDAGEAPPDYCAAFPEDRLCSDGAVNMGVEEALDLALTEMTLPTDAFLVMAEGYDITPDGQHVSVTWDFLFAIPQEDFQYVRVWPDRVTTYKPEMRQVCEPTDAINVGGFTAHVQQAASMFARDQGVEFESGEFFLIARQSSGCVFSGGHEVMLVEQTLPPPYAVEFSAEYPEGVMCHSNVEAGCSGYAE